MRGSWDDICESAKNLRSLVRILNQGANQTLKHNDILDLEDRL